MKRIGNRLVGIGIGGIGVWLGLWMVGVVLGLTGMVQGAKIVGWGSNLDHEGKYVGQATPPTGNDFIAIAAGGWHSLALRSDGSIVGWGSNRSHWTGNYNGQAIPPEGNDFISIAAGDNHSLALRADGSIVAWGSNDNGQTDSPLGNDFVAISAGGDHSIALRSNGSIVAWGDDGWGEIDSPSGNDFVAIIACGDHNLALRANGSVTGWGGNYCGQISCPAGNDFVAIAGWNRSLALRADGSIIGWGCNADGKATPPAGKNYVAITATAEGGLALRADGSIVGWGNNDYGQATPPAGKEFVAIEAGQIHSLALKKAGAMSPTPADNTEDVSKNTILKWVPNDQAQSHDVYLGTDRDRVINATTSSPEFQGSTTESSYKPASLKSGATYYWRIDTILPSETYKGDLWQFTTLPTCYHTLNGDLNQDCAVNILDLALLSEEWMRSEPALIARFTLKTNPNWITQGQWEFGEPTGTGGVEFGNPDPTAGYTGASVYGVNLSGDYTLVTGPVYALTAGPIDCSNFSEVSLRFARWLNTDAPVYVQCKVEASNDNTNWQTVWSNPTEIEDNAWNLVEYDISSVAGSQSSVYLRWIYQVLSARALPYSGWNIDDIELLGKRLP